MARVPVVIIGAGQAGLATSQVLTRAGVDHVVLERGRIGNSWRTERWDSLRLLTPNWMTRLPGGRYRGPDPQGYMRAVELADFLEDYARSNQAPVLEQTPVHEVRRTDGGFEVETARETFRTPNVVVATGAASASHRPAFHRAIRARQISPLEYRNPSSVEDGGVLVVGASASGVQLADELSRAGHEVTLSVGEHIRLPRRYHGRDILWWLDRMGRLRKRVSTDHHEPSLQLVGSPEGRTLDLGTLSHQGVRLVGRTLGADAAGRVLFDDRLGDRVAAAERRMGRILDRIDGALGSAGARPDRLALESSTDSLDLRAEGIRTVVWATGLRPHLPWLKSSVSRSADGVPLNHGGVTGVPGLYVVGMPLQLRRNSAQIDGVGFIARRVGSHIARTLATSSRLLALAS